MSFNDNDLTSTLKSDESNFSNYLNSSKESKSYSKSKLESETNFKIDSDKIRISDIIEELKSSDKTHKSSIMIEQEELIEKYNNINDILNNSSSTEITSINYTPIDTNKLKYN